MAVVNEMDIKLRIVNESDEKIHKKEEQESWETVYAARQNRSILKAELRGIEHIQNRICGVLFIGKVKGLLPFELSGFERPYQLNDMIGQELYFKVIQLDRDTETFAASRVEAIEHLQGLTWNQLREGMKVEAKVLRALNRGLRLEIGAIEVDVPVDEISYEWIDNEKLEERFPSGESLVVKVLEINKEDKKLKVSRKAVLENPWPDCTRRYHVHNAYKGVVSGVVEYGVFVNLEPGVDCLCSHPSHDVGKVKIGDSVLVRIYNADVDSQKITGRIRKRIR